MTVVTTVLATNELSHLATLGGQVESTNLPARQHSKHLSLLPSQ